MTLAQKIYGTNDLEGEFLTITQEGREYSAVVYSGSLYEVEYTFDNHGPRINLQRRDPRQIQFYSQRRDELTAFEQTLLEKIEEDDPEIFFQIPISGLI